AAESGLGRHVGYYLLDAGRPALEARLGCRLGARAQALRWARQHGTGLYLTSVVTLTLVVLALLLLAAFSQGCAFLLLGLLALAAIIPASEIAVQVTNFLVTQFMPPQFLPKMDFEAGIPESDRTLVVVPMMLLTPESIREQAAQLEIRYLANPDEGLLYGLLSDFSDAPQKEMSEDYERLDVVKTCIEQLNQQYGDRFFLFHREREWSESEGRFIGWERKRGKLEHLNRYLVGESGPELDNLLVVGDAQKLAGIAFVITLDADTQLPHDSARHLVETMAHPLNRAVLSPERDRVERGYGIIQPRVSTSLPSATTSLFSRIFTDATGTDPYTHVSSDVYQDLAGEGSYHGKGIYDLAVFHRILTNRFRESHLLSHDLIEGAHVRVGLSTDIELLDLFPQDYLAYARRSHRWIRGDWQIIDWLLPEVPQGSGKDLPNPLNALNRWKIGDNLRRSLTPLAMLAMLVVGCFAASTAVGAFIAILLLLPALATLLARLMMHPAAALTAWNVTLRDAGRALVRGIILAAMIPHDALSALDAIVRVGYRRMISHKLLLQWETSQVSGVSSAVRQRRHILGMLWIPLVFIPMAVLLQMPAHAAAVSPFLALWIVSPLIVAWVNIPMQRQAAFGLTAVHMRTLRKTARLTWRFFSEFINDQSNWLPPDNYQEALRTEVAQRTSPTNIGLALLSSITAHDLGYITIDEALGRTRATMRTIDKMERYEGHLLNWYDTRTLEPLLPRYVSMVDSGNLVGAIWALEQGLEELLAAPILSSAAIEGLRDSIGLLKSSVTQGSGAPLDPNVQSPLAELDALAAAASDSLDSLVNTLRGARPHAQALKAAVSASQHGADAAYWSGEVDRQVASWNGLIDRYLGWTDVLATQPEGGLISLRPEAHVWRREALKTAPSLQTLATGDVPGLRILVALSRQPEAVDIPEGAHAWLETLQKEVTQARCSAVERLEEARETLDQARRLGDGTNMKFLFDHERRMFYTGYNVSDRRMDGGHYDLLASEARLGSFVAIARGEAPVEHWWALGRPYGMAYGRRALLSWSGTMFEYLM
ncbi:MAG TPA: hypothetical protein VKT77_07880, partial [Chthonomonadaceae bacterium]|nr:hypothetical protein [Chthonomonadaceae bacterium]